MRKPRTFVMGDIHGMYKALVQCLERAGFDKEIDTLIQLGDVADRGPDLFECVEELLTIKNLVAIHGNHDDWHLDWLRAGHREGIDQGGRSAVDSYVKHCNGEAGLVIPQEHKDFFASQLPFYMDSDLNLFVHGGFNRHQYLYEHKEAWVFWWDRDLWHTALSYRAMQNGLVYKEPGGGNVTKFKIKEPCKEVFIGHTPTILWKEDKPMHAANIWNLDTGAGMYQKLTIMDLETKQYWQSDLISELYNDPYESSAH